MRTANLPPGEHDYVSVIRRWKQGLLSFAEVRTAAGCTKPLLGVSPEQYDAIRAALRRPRAHPRHG